MNKIVNKKKRMSIENLLNGAKTAEQKKKALSKIQKELKKNWLSALIYGLVYFVNTSFLLISCSTLLFDEEDKALLEKLPGFLNRILSACNKWILSVPEWAVFDRINEWLSSVSEGNIESLPMWIICLAVVAVAIIIVPSIIIVIVKAIIAVFTIKDGDRRLNGTLPECCKKTYASLKTYRHRDLDGFEYNLACTANVIFCIILALLMIWVLIYGVFFSEQDRNIISFIISTIVRGALLVGALYLALTCLAFIPSCIAAYGKMAVHESDLHRFEKFWAEVDPAKKIELDKQKEKDLKRWEKEREEREEISRVLRSGIIDQEPPISGITGKPVQYNPERSFTDGGPTGCGIGGSFCGCGAGR